MWKKISFLVFLTVMLAGCTTKPSANPDSVASLCQILRNRIEAFGQDTTPYMDTMKRKNPADQAELLREYYSYDCPVIVDFTPPP